MVSCAKEIITKTASSGILTEEELLAEGFTDKEVTRTEKGCNDECTSTRYPGSSDSFSGALGLMELERHINGGVTQNPTNKTSPESSGACNTTYFTRCGSWMVLIGGDQALDRTELKIPSGSTSGSNTLSLGNFAEMKFHALVEDIPTTNDNSSKGVTVGQVHNRYSGNGGVKGPLVRVYITKHTNKMRMVVRDDFRDNPVYDHYDLIDCREGDQFTLRFKIRTNGTVEVTAENLTKTSGTLNAQRSFTPDSNWDNADGHYYFKTGVYNQASGNNPRISYKYLNLRSID